MQITKINNQIAITNNRQKTNSQPHFGKFSKETLDQIMTTKGVFNKIGENELIQKMFNYIHDYPVLVKNNGNNLTAENCITFIKNAAYKLTQLDKEKKAANILNNQKADLIKKITDIDLDIEAKRHIQQSYRDALSNL